MLPNSPIISETPREQAIRLLTEAMRRDMDDQRALVAARAKGETAAVFWARRSSRPTF